MMKKGTASRARPRARKLATALAVGAASVGFSAAVAGAGSSGGSGPYRVRAIFDNASFVIPGEDVKVAGVKVGAIDSLDLTPQHKAAVVLRIDDPAFAPFRRDAHCAIRLQSLIGEQFVDCEPTQPRADGTPPPAELALIRSGPGRGQHLLPVANTSTPIGVDLLQDIMRVPEQQRFRVIVSELGAGLAANGENLRAALRRADPALGQLDRVVATLGGQNRLLGRLVDESDADLAPFAAHRRALGRFIASSARTAAASAARGDDLERDFQKLPGFLRRLGPAADRFGALADRMTPALRQLNGQAADINATVADLGPTAKASIPALRTLGTLADRGRRIFPEIGPLADRLNGLATPLRPLASDLAALSGSFDSAGGIESVMRFIYFYTGAVNGEDAMGHYVRSLLDVSSCAQRTQYGGNGCESNFDRSAQSSSATAALAGYLFGKEATP
jgi:phospholipid/cholesterol/gamma-HCH transport system substrate-binding protein